MTLENGELGGFIAETPQEIAQKAVELYQDRTLWAKSQTKGFNVVNELFSEERNFPPLFETIHQSLESLASIRANNIVGGILW